MQKIFLVLMLTLLFTQNVFAAHLYLEKEYQNAWCGANNGVTEYILPDNTRIDCVTNDYAIEFDFANKWAEAIGQSLYYGVSLGKKAGIVLILENNNRDEKYLNRLLSVAKLYNIKVWTVTPEILFPMTFCDN